MYNLGLFFKAPRIFFSQFDENKNIVNLLILFFTLLLAINYFYSFFIMPSYINTNIDYVGKIAEKMRMPVQDVQIKLLNQLKTGRYFIPITTIFVVLLPLIFYSLIFYLIFNLLGYDATLKHVFKVISYSSIWIYISYIIILPIAFIKKDPFFSFNLYSILNLDNISIYLESLLKNINLSQIIFFIYIALGIIEINKISEKNKAYFIIFSVWFLIFLIKSTSTLVYKVLF